MLLRVNRKPCDVTVLTDFPIERSSDKHVSDNWWACRHRVCLSANISPEPVVRTSPNFLAMARSSSGGVAICYVLPVLWLTTCFNIMDRAYKQATRKLHVCKMTQHGFDIPKTTADNLPVYAKMTTKHFY